jgi:hypothetical protein
MLRKEFSDFDPNFEASYSCTMTLLRWCCAFLIEDITYFSTLASGLLILDEDHAPLNETCDGGTHEKLYERLTLLCQVGRSHPLLASFLGNKLLSPLGRMFLITVKYVMMWRSKYYRVSRSALGNLVKLTIVVLFLAFELVAVFL